MNALQKLRQKGVIRRGGGESGGKALSPRGKESSSASWQVMSHLKGRREDTAVGKP